MIKHYPSAYTPEEVFRVYDTLPDYMIEDLLAAPSNVLDPVGLNNLLHDAKVNLPEEDFLHEEMRWLNGLHKNLRGANRVALQEIITSIEEALHQQYNASEYALELISQVQTELDGLVE